MSFETMIGPFGKNITGQLLRDFSWCVSGSLYDSESRIYRMTIVDDPEEPKRERDLSWSGIKNSKATPHDLQDLDDGCMDCLIEVIEQDAGIGINVYLHTDKYTIEFLCEQTVAQSDRCIDEQ